jgi:hypothetical protein
LVTVVVAGLVVEATAVALRVGAAVVRWGDGVTLGCVVAGAEVAGGAVVGAGADDAADTETVAVG